MNIENSIAAMAFVITVSACSGPTPVPLTTEGAAQLSKHFNLDVLQASSYDCAYHKDQEKLDLLISENDQFEWYIGDVLPEDKQALDTYNKNKQQLNKDIEIGKAVCFAEQSLVISKFYDNAGFDLETSIINIYSSLPNAINAQSTGILDSLMFVSAAMELPEGRAALTDKGVLSTETINYIDSQLIEINK